MIEIILNFIWEVFFYFFGYWVLKAITFGRFDDDKGSPFVSVFGLLVVIFLIFLIVVLRD